MTLRPVGDASSRIFMETFCDTRLSSDSLTPSETLQTNPASLH
ncbi:MAG: hypothetical protein V2I97_04645 [Desulfococcaceae bacterium]|jgi:hypothetical protein|nr:hypothetical protein [Desulfococcaceae bacterium]